MGISFRADGKRAAGTKVLNVCIPFQENRLKKPEKAYMNTKRLSWIII